MPTPTEVLSNSSTVLPLTESERSRVQAVVEVLASVAHGSSSHAALTHDARNMVTSLSLYCDLLEEPGVLAEAFQHYAQELRLVAEASRKLVDRIAACSDRESFPAYSGPALVPAGPLPGCGSAAAEGRVIHDLADELDANRNLLDAVAGMGVSVTVRCKGGRWPVRMAGEDLTRILVNLVKNAAEAMRGNGGILLELTEQFAPGASPYLLLAVEDSGPGIPLELRDKVFETGYSTHTPSVSGWASAHRGLGLSITRSLVDEAGGRICLSHGERGGARFEIELPVLA